MLSADVRSAIERPMCHNFCGAQITESMGEIVDHDHKHLGHSDMMVIQTRRRLIQAALDLRERGVVPPGQRLSPTNLPYKIPALTAEIRGKPLAYISPLRTITKRPTRAKPMFSAAMINGCLPFFAIQNRTIEPPARPSISKKRGSTKPREAIRET
jgi:hypothetical protein